MSNRVIAVGFALSAILTAGAATAVSATASPAVRAGSTAVHPNVVRMHVCAQTLYVRTQPLGQAIGTLLNGETFDVERYDASAQWAYGMAYGSVNQHGWVEASWLC